MYQLSINVFNILILIGCAQGLLLAILLLRNSKFRKKSNTFLAVMILSFSLSNIRQFFIDIGLAQQYPAVWHAPLVFGFLIPVVFYFFVQHLIQLDYNPGKKFYWLLLPFFLHFAFQTSGLLLFLFDSPFLYSHSRAFRNISVGMEVGSILYSLIFIIVVLIKIAEYEKKLRDNFSNLKNRTLGWLRNLVFALSSLWILWGIPYLYEVFTNHFMQWHHYPLWIGMSVIVYWIGYSAYSRTEVFQPLTVSPATKNQSLISERADEHYARLLECMKIKKPFLNAELSLESLASEIDLSAGYLSQIINKKEENSFYDFINKYRIEEAKRILTDPKFDHWSILGVGLESGFNSKSTFNAAFKKYTGTTPSAYKLKNRLISW